jgi:hypothetical protein
MGQQITQHVGNQRRGEYWQHNGRRQVPVDKPDSFARNTP